MKIISNKDKFRIRSPDPLPKCPLWAIMDQVNCDVELENLSPELPKVTVLVPSASSNSSELSTIIRSLDEESAERSKKEIVVHESFTILPPSSSRKHIFLPKDEFDLLKHRPIFNHPLPKEECQTDESDISDVDVDPLGFEKVDSPPIEKRPPSLDPPQKPQLNCHYETFPVVPQNGPSVSHEALGESRDGVSQKHNGHKKQKLFSPIQYVPKTPLEDQLGNSNEPLQKRQRVDPEINETNGQREFGGSHLINVARNPEPAPYFNNATQRHIVPDFRRYMVTLLDQRFCRIQRKRYVRPNLQELQNNDTQHVYVKHFFFSDKEPYSYQWVRKVKDESGTVIQNSRSALCSYCKEIHFFDIRKSYYATHMALYHGVYPNDYLTPEPLFAGIYHTPRYSRFGFIDGTEERRCVVCPACYELFDFDVGSIGSENLNISSYLRHFKDAHRSRRLEGYFDLHKRH
ncbi:hypothetical protein C7M61_003735 [Candidozyma pseudohaemuli]|uniref:Transcription regulator Rua1 C-terminal domain-containing protein n=1 Tax=Candidozyma pseudohaemuli TaxID=418784 RepID=A0A2P7YLM3_9ASCO|nr:hypothetical protein C7M61_003735 [[Candida] pseudohaemulonii]PSK36871.1 hypothetical protein C7M61_003735 [[Candida] pseudohaemulonii]